MKNLKKVLALVMAFAMAFTMFAGAVAFEDVELGSDYSAAISMLSDLEVVSGNGKGGYEPAKAVTRAEMCVLIANMMNGGKADTARFSGGSNFSDVAHGWWGESAIAYCVQNGITYGVGGGKFAPNREITDAEAVAMLTRAMGYDTAANPLSFPYGNYTAAVNNGIVANIPYAEGSACTKGEAAQMIYDCLFADYARLTANLNVIHGADDHGEGATLIKDVFGLDRACDDAKDCKQHYWVIESISCEDDEILVSPIADKSGKINGDAVVFDCTADVSALVGYKVILWGEDEHATTKGDVDTVKAVEVVDDQVSYDYNSTMDLEDDLGLKDKEVLTSYTWAWDDSLDMLTAKNGNEFVLIDWDNDGDIDWINGTERFYGEILSLNSKKVVVAVDGETYTLALEGDETDEYFPCIWAEDHDYVVDLNAEDGDIVEITVDDARDATITISINTVDPVEMTFDEMDKKGNVYFDGEKVEDDEWFDLGTQSDDLTKAELDTTYDVWFDANGFIVKIAPVSGSTEYAMLLGVADGLETGVTSRDKKAAVEVMYVDGTIAELDVAFDAKIGDGAYDDEDYVFVSDAKIKEIVGGIFEIEMNDDGDVEEMTLVDDVLATAYTYSDKYDEVKYTVNAVSNTVEVLGEDFVFVVDESYVKDTKAGLIVDTDLVAILTVEELEDIDAAMAEKAEDGAYVGVEAVLNDLSNKNQPADADSADRVDDVLFVVDDLAAYLGEKTHVIGAITNVSVKKDIYTFEINDGETKVSTGKIDSTEEIADGEDDVVGDDAYIIDVFANASKADKMSMYGNALYADITLLDDEVIDVELLVDGNMQPVASDSDYMVARALVQKVGSDYVRVFQGAQASSDETIVLIDEVLDANLEAYELTSDTVVYEVADEPALKTGALINDYIAYDKTSMSAGADLADFVSDFEIRHNTETLFVVDFIYDNTDADLPVYAAYAFEPVEDAAYTPAVSYEAQADNTAAVADSKVRIKLIEVVTDALAGTETKTPVALESFDEAAVEVVVKRQVVNTPSTENELVWTVVDVTVGDVAPLNAMWYSVELDGVEAGDMVYVTLNGIECEGFVFA